MLAGVCASVCSCRSSISRWSLLVYFASRKQWKVGLGGAAAILAVARLSIGILGWKIHRDFLVLGARKSSGGKLDLQDPFTASFQSFDSLFRRLFVFDAASNPRPLVALPRLGAMIGVPVIKCCDFAGGRSVRSSDSVRGGSAATTAPSIGILGILDAAARAGNGDAITSSCCGCRSAC